MAVDEALDEWAVGQDRQPLCSRAVQRGFDEQCSQALTLVRRVDLGVDEGDDAGSAPVFGKAQDAPSTAISKRLRSETSVTVGAIASDWARNVVATCCAAASDQFDGASTSSSRAASLLAAAKSPSRPRTKAA